MTKLQAQRGTVGTTARSGPPPARVGGPGAPVNTVNIGILAHVDAGKTSLTERLLYEAGAIDRMGSVDAGTTRSDTLELERRRGITIRSAVVTFALGDSEVNLIDTPGHPDFIAEVERSLAVLDGAILVLSAIEGVQAQTKVLARALTRLGIPTMMFINKIDRMGAAPEVALAEIARRITGSAVPMVSTSGTGTAAATVEPLPMDDPGHVERLVDVLSAHDDGFLARYLVDADALTPADVRAAFRSQIASATAYPVYIGSAITGAGIRELVEGVREFLPSDTARSADPLDAAVFKIEHASSGEKTALVRLFAGTLRPRQKIEVHRRGAFGGVQRYSARVTGLDRFAPGGLESAREVGAGHIVRVRGLAMARVNDRLGRPALGARMAKFPAPALASTIVAADPADEPRLYAALSRLADEDPLIDLQVEDRVVTVRMYGEVQREVIEARLADEFGLTAEFAPSYVVHVERVDGEGIAMVPIDGEGDLLATA